jgi:hypothetical protein
VSRNSKPTLGLLGVAKYSKVGSELFDKKIISQINTACKALFDLFVNVGSQRLDCFLVVKQ